MTETEIATLLSAKPCKCGYYQMVDQQELIEAERMGVLWRIPIRKVCQQCGRDSRDGLPVVQPIASKRLCSHCGRKLPKGRRLYCSMTCSRPKRDSRNVLADSGVAID